MFLKNQTRTFILLCTLALSIAPVLADAPKVFVIHGEPEYGSARTMPALARRLQENLGFETTVLTSPAGTTDLPDLKSLEEADLLILFIRFRQATDKQFEQLKAYFDSGKPAVAFRTTSHAFWEDKGWFVPFFGGHYKSHADNRQGTTCVIPTEARPHPIMDGVEGEFHMAHGGTYNAQPLSDYAAPLLFGKTGDLPAEPVAWVAEYKPGQRLFYTSLGAEENFESAAFRKMVLNSCQWCLAQGSPEKLALKESYPPVPDRKTPAGVTVLFNGNDLSEFRHYDPSVEPRSIGIDRRADTTSGGPVFSKARWVVTQGAAVARPGFGDMVTKIGFGDSVMHFDFLIPREPGHIKGKFRGNSGIYIDGKYEIQIVDSHGGKLTDSRNTCGAIFGVAAPLVNACRKPGEWQKMEIAYSHLDRGVEISAWLNGKQIHDRVRVEEPTLYGFLEEEDREEDENEAEDETFRVAFRGARVKAADMGKDFTAVVRFRTEGQGPLFSKAGENDYRTHDKVLYLFDNRLHYDIGSVGVLETDKDVNDGKWHTAAVRSKDDLVEIFIDGAKAGEKKAFNAPDNGNSVIKIGATTAGVPSDGEEPLEWEGEVFDLQLFAKALDDQDIKLTVGSQPIPGVKPVLEWEPDVIPALEIVGGDRIKEFAMAKPFSVAVRFRTHVGGALWARAPRRGEWAQGGKALFVADETLIYDIGWVGALPAEDVDVADGEWHIATVTHNAGRVKLFVDGKLRNERDEFTSEDETDHVFKVGACSTDFPEGAPKSFRGQIAHLAFFNRELNANEVAGINEGQIPDDRVYAYRDGAIEDQELETAVNGESDDDEEEERTEEETEIIQITNPGEGPIRFQADTSRVRFANIWVSKLGDVDHASIIRAWSGPAFERGRRIYDGLCITCHGNLKQKGSLPTSRPFWKDPFKNGSDPHSLYLTMRNGFNQMPPQPWLTPRQGYDVIHYIREELVKPNNPGQYFKITDDYLAGLPKGLGVDAKLTKEQAEFARGPKYLRMNFGPMLDWTYQVAPDNIAYKGISIRLDEGLGGVSKGHAWMIYDHDTMRVAAAYTGDRFIDWRCIAFDQSHGTHPSIVGKTAFVNPVGPGWANPVDDSWNDPRFRGRDNKPYGPLPREWAHFKGQYLHGNKVVIRYTVGDADILELPSLEQGGSQPVFARTLNIGKTSRDLTMRIAPNEVSALVAGKPGTSPAILETVDGFHRLRIPAAATPLKVKLLVSEANPTTVYIASLASEPAEDLLEYTQGGPARWTKTVVTEGKQGGNGNSFEIDEITYPAENPYGSWMRIGGFDFYPDGKRAAVATWLGDVWIVDGIAGALGRHNWKRICTGLFQPLGVKIVGGKIHVTCRDQIARLHDMNGDEEIDYIESFNNDHQVTEHFHEFAMGLQTDNEGNFYYAKSARHAKTALVAHHGTLLKVSKDGSKTEILANGFRAANGVCLNPDGTFIVTDQEGHWNPKNRINYVKVGGFYGNMYGYHSVTDSSDDAMEQPLCWITNAFDRSPGELLWVPENANWDTLNGQLLNLSYGMGQVFVVPHEKINGQAQGGMCSLGLNFPTGIMRGRFHPENGQLYVTGMFAWAGNKHQDGSFYRIRHTGKPAHLPIGLQPRSKGIKITFTNPLHPDSAQNPDNYQIKIWGLKRTRNYGSRHYNERSLKVVGAKLLADAKSVFLEIPDIVTTWSMEIKTDIKGASGEVVKRTIHNTIHTLDGP